MPKGYWVVTYRSVNDPAKLKAYAKLAVPAIRAFGGRFLVRGQPVATFEAGLQQRVVLIEFDSADAARACYESADYQAALVAFDDGAVRDIRVVEGEG